MTSTCLIYMYKRELTAFDVWSCYWIADIIFPAESKNFNSLLMKKKTLALSVEVSYAVVSPLKKKICTFSCEESHFQKIR